MKFYLTTPATDKPYYFRQFKQWVLNIRTIHLSATRLCSLTHNAAGKTRRSDILLF